VRVRRCCGGVAEEGAAAVKLYQDMKLNSNSYFFLFFLFKKILVMKLNIDFLAVVALLEVVLNEVKRNEKRYGKRET
jgi:hypothetical protein